MNTAKRIILLADLAGWTKACQAEGDTRMAAFLQDYYTVCDEVLTPRSGSIIKFMGDACLADFSPDHATNAIESVFELQSSIKTLAERRQVSLGLGVNLHMATVIDGDFGVGANRRRDIIGRGVNQTFLLGRGPGIRISEPVYRALPSGARSPWIKHKPPAIYHLAASVAIRT